VTEPAAPVRDVRIETLGAAAVVTFDRPRALNALTTDMRAEMARRFPRFARDPQIYCAILQSATARAFSAGGDVRELVAWRRTEPARAERAFAEEYRLDWLLECFSKPTISLIDGMVMGSGVGVSIYGTHRVAGEGYAFAMPETAIGLFPDVGIAHVFARLPGEIGMYLGLSGRTIGRADAFRLGLVTHCIAAAEFEPIRAGLADAEPVDALLDERHEEQGPGELVAHDAVIAHCFSGHSVEEILARLGCVGGAEQAWAAGVAADLRARSPTSLKVTHRHIRGALFRDLRETLQIDYRLACRCLAGHDFAEGVRAALIDKDNRPAWQPARIEDVSEKLVDAYFAPLGKDELVLPPRAEMQAGRV
jgi:enoyl-CoA hydratase